MKEEWGQRNRKQEVAVLVRLTRWVRQMILSMFSPFVLLVCSVDIHRRIQVKRAGSGTRTRTGVASQGILSPLRLPFRHAGIYL